MDRVPVNLLFVVVSAAVTFSDYRMGMVERGAIVRKQIWKLRSSFRQYHTQTQIGISILALRRKRKYVLSIRSK